MNQRELLAALNGFNNQIITFFKITETGHEQQDLSAVKAMREIGQEFFHSAHSYIQDQQKLH